MQPVLIDPESRRQPGRPGLLLIGVDHRCAPLALREKVTYDADQARTLVASLLDGGTVREAVLLSTCNRTELYVRPGDQAKAYRTAFEAAFLARAPEIEHEGRFYVKRDEQAARHLLEVACGLQSMVLGEPEILGQVRQAAARAEADGTSGQLVGRLLRLAVAAGKRARSETEIGGGAVSFGYAVVELGRTIFTRLADCSVLLVGAGDTARQVARNLLDCGARELWVANRSEARSASFREQFPAARAIPFEQRSRLLREVDVVVASTSAPEPIVGFDHLTAAMAERRERPLLAVDLGVPRNIDPRARALENLFLQDVDTLENLIERNLRRRRDQVPRVVEILERELERFAGWQQSLAAEPVIASLQRRAEAIRRRELAAALSRFPEERHDDLERLTRALVRKILHHPSTQLRRTEGESRLDLDAVRALFQLDDGDDTDGGEPR